MFSLKNMEQKNGTLLKNKWREESMDLKEMQSNAAKDGLIILIRWLKKLSGIKMRSKFSLRHIKFLGINGLKYLNIYQVELITKLKIISTAH